MAPARPPHSCALTNLGLTSRSSAWVHLPAGFHILLQMYLHSPYACFTVFVKCEREMKTRREKRNQIEEGRQNIQTWKKGAIKAEREAGSRGQD